MVTGLNIIAWDILAGGIWIFIKLCKWAGRENTGKRTLVVIALMLVGLFAVFSLLIDGGYIEGTEPQTRRTFVVEYHGNMFNKGSAKLYERFGPLLLACDVEEYEGEFLHADQKKGRFISVRTAKKLLLLFSFCNPSLLFR